METIIQRAQSIVEAKDPELIESFSLAREPNKFSKHSIELTKRIHPAIERFYETCGLELKAKMTIPSMFAVYSIVKELAPNGMVDVNIYRQICQRSFQLSIRLENAIHKAKSTN